MAYDLKLNLPYDVPANQFLNIEGESSFSFYRFDGTIPVPGELIDRDREILRVVEDSFTETAEAYEEVRLRDALKEALRVTREVNKYLDDTAPWTAFKSDPGRADTIIYTAIRAIDSLKVLFAPILPESCEIIYQLLGYTEQLFVSQNVVDRTDSTGSYRALTYAPTKAETTGVNRFYFNRTKRWRADYQTGAAL
jgi:methionyl-tRNA synthetase